MKFLHIADLHIGRRMGGISLAEDQRHVLDQIVALAGECDAVLIAGDIYNRAKPDGRAVSMAGDFLSALAAKGKPVFMVAGNHDGGELVAYCGDLLDRFDIHAAGVYDGNLRRHVLRDGYGEIHVYLMPFVKPLNVRSALRDAPGVGRIESYEDAMRAALGRVTLDPAARNVLVAHQFVSGAEISDSEERALGGLEQIPAEVFAGFDYVALGHLHSPQRLCAGRLCYSGSPLKYSLSEEHQRKGATLVTLGPKGSLGLETRPLHALRDVRTVTGTLAQIADPALYSEDFVGAELTDEEPPLDPLGALRTVYPNLIYLRLRNSRTNEELTPEDIELAENKGPLEHFVDFYAHQNNGVPPDERRVAIIRDIIAQVEGESYAAD